MNAYPYEKYQLMNHMQKPEPMPASDWRQRRLTRVVVFFMAW